MRTKIIFSNEQLEDIRKSYLNGESTVKIGQRYGTSHHPIRQVLEEMGIDRNQKRFVRKYSLDENYFDKIDTPNKAYILGLLYADGSNCISKGTVSISLQEEDKKLLEDIREEVHSDKPLEYLDYSKKNNFGYTYKNQYRLLLFSHHICEQLDKIGMIPNKSLKLEVPNLDECLYSHFIRGYFDGDGSLTIRYTQDNKLRVLTTLTSTECFCNRVRNIIQQSVDIPCGNVYDASCHNGVTKVLSISGIRQNQKLHTWLYQDADLYLQRKYDKVLELYKHN